MKKNMILIFIVVLGFVFVLCDLPSVYAQDEFTLEEITVTAQKREENQQKVPIAMQTLSGDVMRELGYNDLEEMMAGISSAFVNMSGDGLRVSIRGMSDDITSSGGLGDMTRSTPTVAVNVDGVYTTTRYSSTSFYDMERVEVLFGPQSTLYTSSSPGGIVNVVTADPKTDAYEVSGTLEYGNYGLLHTEGVVNVPMNDKIALRAAFNTSIHEGYMANGSDDEDAKSARIKALFKFSDKVSFVATGEKTSKGGNGYSGTSLFVSQDDLDDPWDNSNVSTPPPRSQELEKLIGTLNWDLGFGNLSIVSSYSSEHTMATFTRNWMGQDLNFSVDRNGTEKGVELRLASSPDSFFKWIVGANYYRQGSYDMSLPETGEYEYRTVEETTDAFYGNITYPVTDQFRITAGARKTTDTNYLEEEMVKSFGTVWLISETEYDNPDYKIGIEYDLGENSMLYADWSTSYRSVGMPLRPLDPENLVAYTFGSKNRFLENKLELNAAAWYYDYTNYVANFGMARPPSTDIFSGPPNDSGSLTNGDLTKYGVDVQTSWIISGNDKVDFSISYLSSEFSRLLFDFEYDEFQDLDYTGKPETFSPDWTFTLNYSHNFTLANGGALTTRIDTRYMTDYLVTFVEHYQETNTWNWLSREPYITEQAHHISNFNIIYAHPDGKWTLTGYIKNIENYAEKKSFRMNTINLNPPRTYGAILSVRFGG